MPVRQLVLETVTNCTAQPPQERESERNPTSIRTFYYCSLFTPQQQIEDGQRLESGSVHDMTGLVKQFFRELPEPLFTSVFHDSFVRCYNLAPPNQVLSLIHI